MLWKLKMKMTSHGIPACIVCIELLHNQRHIDEDKAAILKIIENILFNTFFLVADTA